MRRHAKEELDQPEIMEETSNSKNYSLQKDNATKSSDQHHQHSFTGAFILIILGTLFLLNNFGILPWIIWRDLWRFWPLFLIFWGFQMIFGNSKIARILLLLLSLLIVTYFIFSTLTNYNPQLSNYLKSQYPFLNSIPVPPTPPSPPESSSQKRPILFEDEENQEEDDFFENEGDFFQLP